MEPDLTSLFQPQILDRGYAYYLEGAVQDLQQTATQITARVMGSQRYTVTVALNGDTVVGMTCDCPYAAQDKNCKHMAAVLFAVEDAAEGPASTAESSDDKKLAQQLVTQSTPDQLREFLTDVLAHDALLMARFQHILRPQVPTAAAGKAEIDAICAAYADTDGFIDYRAAEYFETDIQDYLDHDLEALVAAHQDEAAFEVLSFLFLKLDDLDIDDSDGEIVEILDTSVRLWRQVIRQAPIAVKRRIFTWLTTQVQRPLNAIGEDVRDLLFGDDFSDQEFLQGKLDLANKMIRRLQASPEEATWELNMWLTQLLATMTAAQVADEKIEATCQRYLQYTDVRDYYVEFCLQRHRVDQAIALLQEGKRVNRDLLGVVVHDSHRLAEIYHQQHDMANYRQELWRLLTSYNVANLDDFKAYKATFSPVAWPAQRTKLFKVLQPKITPAALAPLYAYEELQPELLQAILAERGIDGLRKYGPALKNQYAAKIIHKYAQFANQAMTSTGPRKHYRRIVDILQEMATYPMGDLEAQQLIRDWQQKYPRRSAMLDELSRFKP